MLCKELANELLKYPDADVMLSIDISTSEENYSDRAFSEYIECVQVNDRTDLNDDKSATHCSVIAVGYLNNRLKTPTKKQNAPCPGEYMHDAKKGQGALYCRHCNKLL